MCWSAACNKLRWRCLFVVGVGRPFTLTTLQPSLRHTIIYLGTKGTYRKFCYCCYLLREWWVLMTNSEKLRVCQLALICNRKKYITEIGISPDPDYAYFQVCLVLQAESLFLYYGNFPHSFNIQYARHITRQFLSTLFYIRDNIWWRI